MPKMLVLCHGWNKTPLLLYNTSRYIPEQIEQMAKRQTSPYWLRVDGTHVRVNGRHAFKLACEAVCVYHNSVCTNAPDQTTFIETIAQVELRVEAHMDASSSEGDDGVYSEDDIDYDTIYR